MGYNHDVHCGNRAAHMEHAIGQTYAISRVCKVHVYHI